MKISAIPPAGLKKIGICAAKSMECAELDSGPNRRLRLLLPMHHLWMSLDQRVAMRTSKGFTRMSSKKETVSPSQYTSWLIGFSMNYIIITVNHDPQ